MGRFPVPRTPCSQHPPYPPQLSSYLAPLVLPRAQGRGAPHREFPQGASEQRGARVPSYLCEGLEFLGLGVLRELLVPWQQPDLQLVSPSRVYPLEGLPDLH